MKRLFVVPGIPVESRFRTAVLLFAATMMVFSLHPPASSAQSAQEKTFSSPGDAVLAFYKAAKAGDAETLNAILGSNAGKILRSGDDVADKNLLSTFVAHYDQMHRLVLEPDQTATLYIGPANWPMPISLVKNNGGSWYFDTEAGTKEILYRRIGRNESEATETLHALIDAQKEYASSTHDGEKVKHYAIKLISDEGKHDGLYWKTSGSEPPSPVGPLLAAAADEGYTRKQGRPDPYRGYIFRPLTRQGPDAKGGARDYMSNGQLTRGVAFLAYPAEYRNSGVMTFIVSQDDVVYEKDLGPDTAKEAEAISEFNPDPTWTPSD
jgi:hypothetical protein